jgi:hypothetical protein
VPDDAQPAGSELIDAELIDFLTGDLLIDPLDQEVLTGDAEGTLVLVEDEGLTPLTVVNTTAANVPVNVVNASQSEVEVSLLGIPRSETALGLFDAVNIYGINNKEFYADQLRLVMPMRKTLLIGHLPMTTVISGGTSKQKVPFKHMLFLHH